MMGDYQTILDYINALIAAGINVPVEVRIALDRIKGSLEW